MEPLGPVRPFVPKERLSRAKSLSILDLKVSKVTSEVLFSSESGPSTEASSASRKSPLYESPPFDLDQLALPEGEGLGYKSANLIRLQEVALRLHVEVPAIMPLSHHMLMAHIVASYPNFRLDYEKFLDSLGYPPELTQEAVSLLKVIQERIKQAFINEKTLSPSILTDWLSRCSSEFVAVRSTGKEDSDTNSNAGGNLSNPFVKKEPLEISKNIGEVIASYFSEKSISQRIASKDPSLVTDREPFVPVLLQEAVAEPLDGSTEERFIPRSGVMFVKKDVSELCVGYGHNEGIVSSEVRTDCYRFCQSGTVQKVVQNKPTRFRGIREFDGVVSCGPVRVKRELAQSPTLDEHLLKRMQSVAKGLYGLYGKEMDVEFTIIGDQIFLLQARPLNTLKLGVSPSYLTEIEGGISCDSLTTGGCYVRRVEKEEEVLVCKTIKDAYQLYKERGEEIKAVVIEETAPRTSHEAVFFIGIGIPVLVSSEEFRLDPPYLVDPQQGVIARSGRVEEGYICFPIPLQYSMKASALVEQMHRYTYDLDLSRKVDVDRGLSQLKERIGPRLGRSVRSIRELSDCLYRLKSADPDDVEIALSQIVYCIAAQAFREGISSKNRIELIMILENLLDVIENDYFTQDAMSMERLFGARLIEACLFQTGAGMIGGSSYIRVLTDIKNEERGIQELIDDKTTHLHPLERETIVKDLLFIKIGRQLLKTDLQERWKKVLTYLPSLPEMAKNRLLSLFLLVDKTGDSTEFINVALAKLLLESSDDPELFFSKLEDLTLQLVPTLEKALELKNFSDDLKASIGAFSSSKNIRKGLPRILERLKKIGLTRGAFSIAHRYQMASSEERLILIQALREVVTSFDHLIKACTGSTEYTSDLTQASDFLALLRPYREMMLVVKKMSGILARETFNERNYELPDRLDGISEREAKDLRDVSPGFDVTKIIESERVYYTIAPPSPAATLEEKFTVFHQTMEHHLSCMAVDNGFSIEMLPKNLQIYISGIDDKKSLAHKQLTSIDIEKNRIKVNFSVPLRDHAAKLSFSYDTTTQKVDLHLSIFGGNEGGRWREIEQFGLKAGQFLGIDIKPGRGSETESSIVAKNLELDGDFGAEVIAHILGALLDQSLGETVIDLMHVIPIQFHTRDFVTERVFEDPAQLQFVRRDLLTEELIRIALEKNEYALEFVPFEMQTPEMVAYVIEKNPNLLGNVRPDLISDDLIYLALRKSTRALKYLDLEKQNLTLILELVARDGLALEFVRPDLKTKRVVELAIDRNLGAFAFIPEEMQTVELAMKACSFMGDLLQFVRKDLKIKPIIDQAIGQNIKSIRYVPFDLQTEEMALSAVSRNAMLLRYVSPSLMSRKVIQTALMLDPDAIEFIPTHLRTAEMVDPEFQRGTLGKIFYALGGMLSRFKR